MALTLGSGGCYVAGAEFEGDVPAFPVRAVDGTGAGDAFAAGILYGRLAGWPLVDAARLANAAGALADDCGRRDRGSPRASTRPWPSRVWGRRREPRALGRKAAASRVCRICGIPPCDTKRRRVSARLNRLFAADGRCFDVAVDHGFFGEGTFLAGIETMEWAIATLVEAGPDAIQLSPGEAPYLQRFQGPQKPALVLRTDVANVYGANFRAICSASSSPGPSNWRCGSMPPAWSATCCSSRISPSCSTNVSGTCRRCARPATQLACR